MYIIVVNEIVIVERIVMIDDFCKIFTKNYNKRLLIEEVKKRIR